MKYLTIVVKVEDGFNASELMNNIESTEGITISASCWSHAMDDRDFYKKKVEDNLK